MSIDSLKADLIDNMKEAKALSMSITTSVGDLAKHLTNTFWPFVENVVTEMEDLDEGLADLYHGAEDILQPETAQLFATVIAGGSVLVAELEKRLTPADAQLVTAIKEWRTAAHEAGETLEQIVVTPAEGDELDDDEEVDEGDDEDDDEDDKPTQEKH